MQMHRYSVYEASRKLDVPESTVRRLIRAGRIEVMDVGAQGKYLLSGIDVDRVAEQRAVEDDCPTIRTVALIDIPELVHTALRVAALVPHDCGTLLEAMNVFVEKQRPIVITSPDAFVAERELHDFYATQDVVVTEWTPEEPLRELVRRIWREVQRRHDDLLASTQGSS